MISVSGISRVLTMDLHAGQIQGFFDAPVDNLYASGILSMRMEALLADVPKEDLVIVSPDAGGAERARYFARRLLADLAIIDKRRERANHSEVMNVIGNVEGKVAIIVDDLVDTAGTLCKAASALKAKGATKVYACCTHPVLSGPAIDRLNDSVIEKLLVSDTIMLQEEKKACPIIETVSSAPLFGEAIKAIHENLSISRLFL
jgi:ribose-phosphate pyrophosphokinase